MGSQVEVGGAPLSWDATIWESQRGHATQYTTLLPRDMEGLKRTRQHDMFMFLKRDLPW